MKFEYESNDERIDELRQLAELLMDGRRAPQPVRAARRAPSDEFDILLPNLMLSVYPRRRAR